MPSDRIIWLATQNRHKLEEARTVLAQYGVRVGQLPATKLEIQSPDLEKISKFAADRISSTHAGMVAAEDSGLFVNALKGFPGPFSAHAYETIGTGGILRLLLGAKHRDAFFESSIALSEAGRCRKVFTGRVSGKITGRERGRNGFGFDPIFIPEGTSRTFGEMSLARKNQYSHRSRAFRKLARWYLSQDPVPFSRGALK